MKKLIKISIINKGKKFRDLLNKDHVLDNEIKNKKDFWYFFSEENGKKQIENKFIKNVIGDSYIPIKYYKQSLILAKDIQLNNETKTLVISIGDNRKYIDKWLLERNFGIKIGINYAISNLNNGDIQIGEVTSKNKASGDNYKENKNHYTSFSNYNFPRLSTMLKKIKIKVTFKEQKVIWNLGEWLEMPIDENLTTDKLFSNIEKIIYDNYSRDDYKNYFEFIDHFSEVDNTLANELTKNAWEYIKNDKKMQDFIIAWPEFLPENHSYFKVEGDPQNFFNLEIEDIINKAQNQRKKMQNVKLHSFDNNDKIIDIAPLSRCLYGELKYKENTFLINEGRWSKVNKNFYEKVTNDYKKIIISELDLPAWNTNLSEYDYNKKVVEEKSQWKLLDRKTINFNSQNKLELCDILATNESSLIAIKRFHNSESISHLAKQVENAISAINNAKEVVNAKIRNDKNPNDDISNYEDFILAIATDEYIDSQEKKQLPKIPFFAMLSINELFERPPRALNIKVKYISKNK